jgi:hypothetical protein
MFTVFWVCLGLEPVNIYHMRVLSPSPWYAMTANVINGTVLRGERVAVVSDVQAYEVERDAIFDCDAPGSRRWIHMLARRHRDADAFARQFRQWRARTVFYIRGKALSAALSEEWEPSEIRSWALFWNSRARLVYQRGKCAVYDLGPPKRPAPLLDLPGPQDWLIGRMLMVQRDPAALGSVFRGALASGAESGFACGVYGDLSGAAGKTKDAIPALRRATAIAPGSDELWFSLARALIRADRLKDARIALERGRALNLFSDELPALEEALSSLAASKRSPAR